MGSLAGILQRPLIAAAAVVVTSVSADISDKFQSFRSSQEQLNSTSTSTSSWVSHDISISKLSNLFFLTRLGVPVPNINLAFVPKTWTSSGLPSSFVLVNSYKSAELAKAAKPTTDTSVLPLPSPPDVLYRWHLPKPNAIDFSGTSDCSMVKSRTVVVMLGWLGAKQKHLKRYADWYTSKGFHVITFTFPLAEILSYQVGGKAEQNIQFLVNHLADWLEEEGKNLVFHTFSNTGWLTYGAILEKFQKQDPSLMGRIRGCIVDSAPVAAPDPQVWASGFSAALLKKHSVATKGVMNNNESDEEVLVDSKAITETALLVVLEKFFDVVLHLPAVNRRLCDVLGLLSSGQPSCPQLYIYSSADRVIPAQSVESFIEIQRRAGREVRACNFVSTPHVDHYRNDPKLYTTQLSQFLDCVVTYCKHS